MSARVPAFYLVCALCSFAADTNPPANHVQAEKPAAPSALAASVQGNATTAHNAASGDWWSIVIICAWAVGPPLFMMIEWFCIGRRRKKLLPELTAERSILSAER